MRQRVRFGCSSAVAIGVQGFLKRFKSSRRTEAFWVKSEITQWDSIYPDGVRLLRIQQWQRQQQLLLLPPLLPSLVLTIPMNSLIFLLGSKDCCNICGKSVQSN